MGDAVLLAFDNPLNAFLASADFMSRFDGAEDKKNPLRLRITLNRGVPLQKSSKPVFMQNLCNNDGVIRIKHRHTQPCQNFYLQTSQNIINSLMMSVFIIVVNVLIHNLFYLL